MLVRGVGNDDIRHHLQPQPVRFSQQCVEISKCPEERVNIAVIRYVVAEILHRRFRNRGDPDRVCAEFGDVGQVLDNALQIADAIAVAVLKAARVDLIDHRPAPPVGIGVRRLLRHRYISKQGACILLIRP